MHTIGNGDDFEWDKAKAASNLRKHGIDFADAALVFTDERAMTIPDDISAVDERRFLTLGRDSLRRVLVVAFTWRGPRIHLISARRATPAERRKYEEVSR